MTKIAFIGAGSTVFAKNLLGDILGYPELSEATISLMDINPERLTTSEVVAQRVAEALGAHPTIETTTDRRAALDGADYAINMIQVGGYRPSTVIDFEIPKKYGLRQTIADTLGIGGIMRALRTIPVVMDMAHDMEEVCPDVVFLNYVNPMAMITGAVQRATSIQTVGLCHSVQGTAMQLARDIDVPFDDVAYFAAGINHMCFYLRYERRSTGEDLYPLRYKVIEEGRVPEWNRVRYEILKRIGYFITESSEHLAEYTPHFIRKGNPELIEKFNVPLDEYPRRCENQIAGWEALRQRMTDPDEELEVRRSHEYGSLIIHSIETNQPRVIYGNVLNQGLIDNLPAEACVEVPVLVDAMGLQPVRVGRLPEVCAAMNRTNLNVQFLTIKAALEKDRQSIYHAAMMDPLTRTNLTLDEIWALVDDLIEAHGAYTPFGPQDVKPDKDWEPG